MGCGLLRRLFLNKEKLANRTDLQKSSQSYIGWWIPRVLDGSGKIQQTTILIRSSKKMISFSVCSIYDVTPRTIGYVEKWNDDWSLYAALFQKKKRYTLFLLLLSVTRLYKNYFTLYRLAQQCISKPVFWSMKIHTQ